MSLLETAAEVAVPELALPIRIWRALTGGVGAVLRWATADLWRAAFLAATALAAWALIGRAEERAKANKDEAALAHVKAAQPIATAAQIAANHQPALVSRQIAEESNAETPEYLARVRAAGAAYAAAHPVIVQRADPARGTGHADLPGSDHPAPLDDRPAGPADVRPDAVAVSRSDFEKLVAAAGRLAKVHQDADRLIASGVAVAEGE